VVFFWRTPKNSKHGVAKIEDKGSTYIPCELSQQLQMFAFGSSSEDEQFGREMADMQRLLAVEKILERRHLGHHHGPHIARVKTHKFKIGQRYYRYIESERAQIMELRALRTVTHRALEEQKALAARGDVLGVIAANIPLKSVSAPAPTPPHAPMADPAGCQKTTNSICVGTPATDSTAAQIGGTTKSTTETKEISSQIYVPGRAFQSERERLEVRLAEIDGQIAVLNAQAVRRARATGEITDRPMGKLYGDILSNPQVTFLDPGCGQKACQVLLRLEALQRTMKIAGVAAAQHYYIYDSDLQCVVKLARANADMGVPCSWIFQQYYEPAPWSEVMKIFRACADKCGHVGTPAARIAEASGPEFFTM
jgi:hypothetical protein